MSGIHDVIVQLRETGSSKEKQEILFANKNNGFLREFLRVCYEPRINFYQSKVDPSLGTQPQPTRAVFDESCLSTVIAELAERHVTGHEAKRWLAGFHASFDSWKDQELVELLIARDVKAGVSTSTINKVWPGLITDVPYMRCSLPKASNLSKFDWKSGVFSQIKADGMFAAITHHDNGTVTIESRNGSPFPLSEFKGLVAEFIRCIPPGYQIHGELVVQHIYTTLSRQEGNGLLNKILKGGELPSGHRVTFEAWDIIPSLSAVAKGSYPVPYGTRYSNLVGMVDGKQNQFLKMIPTTTVYSFEAAQNEYTVALADGLEGTIIKDPRMIWRDGTSKDQVKMKLEFEVELRVRGYVEGSGKNAGMLGALECASECGKLTVNVGSGLTDKMRKEIWESRDLDVITVKANSIMPPENKNYYSLFLPIFVEARTDKKVADTLERIQEQFEAATR